MMLNRRKFFKHAGTVALGTWFLPSCNTQESQKQDKLNTAPQPENASSSGNTLGPIGIQLFSVKDVLEQDIKGTLQQLADIGYKEIESFPGNKGHYYGMAPKEFQTMLNEMGLELVSSHFGSGSREAKADSWRQATMLSNFEQLVDKAAETGQQYLTCSWMDESLRKSPDDLKRTAELFNRTGETCKQAGLQFAYHNHAFEFEKVGDTVLYDFMLENTDPELVKWEMDIFWLVAGGYDPVAYFEKYPGRFPLGHVKDMDKQDQTKNTELGKGTIQYGSLLKAAREAGMKHYLVEQESFTRPSLESMRMNYKYLSTLQV